MFTLYCDKCLFTSSRKNGILTKLGKTVLIVLIKEGRGKEAKFFKF